MTTVYDFSAETLDGEPAPLDRLARPGAADRQHRVASAASPASTPGWRRSIASIADQPFEVLGFPCNQFGAQEPGEAAEIANFCSLHATTSTFPMFDKVDVNGPDRHPLYAWLTEPEERLPRLPRPSSGTSPSS